MKKVYEFVVVYNPPVAVDVHAQEEAKLVAEGRVLAADDKVAMLLAGKKIPDEFMSKIDYLSVAVRPF